LKPSINEHTSKTLSLTSFIVVLMLIYQFSETVEVGEGSVEVGDTTVEVGDGENSELLSPATSSGIGQSSPSIPDHSGGLNTEAIPAPAGVASEPDSVSVDPTTYLEWGMDADDIVSASAGDTRLIVDDRITVKTRAYFETIATGLFKTDLFEFDVTFRATPGEAALGLLDLDLTNDPSPRQHDNLSSALAVIYGEGTQTINDTNSAATLTRTTWSINNEETVSLIYLQDRLGEDRLTVKYQGARTVAPPSEVDGS
jgi:hypothetical protein